MSPDPAHSYQKRFLSGEEDALLFKSKKSKWDDLTFEERTYKGWLLPYLLEIDFMFHKRWDYWIRTLLAGKLLDESIPQIDFLSPHPEAMKNFRNCMENYICHSVRLPDFLEWLLWGFGEQNARVKISAEVNEHWYRTFNMGLLMQHPYDYFGDILADTKAGKTYWSNPNAFYPTPHNLVKMMTAMTMGKQKSKGKDSRMSSVLDPCVGTGRFLMEASNYSLNLYGADIDPVCVMACKVNGYFYVPWLVKSGNGRVKGLERQENAS